MTIYEVLTLILVVVLAAASTAAIFFGLLRMMADSARRLQKRRTYPVKLRQSRTGGGGDQVAGRVEERPSSSKASYPGKTADVVVRRGGSVKDTRELEAHMAFDQAVALLTAQRDNLKGIQSKAKDLIGLLTLSATFLGAFGHANADAVLNSVKSYPGWVSVVFLAFPVFTLCAAIYAMTPSGGWIFNLDPTSVRDVMKQRDPAKPFTSAEAFYLAYVTKLKEFEIKNDGRLDRRFWALWLATGALVITIVFTGILVMIATPVTK